MHIVRTRKHLHWIIPVAIVGSLVIFAVTFLAYVSAHNDHRVAGYYPAILGLLCFSTLVLSINYLSLPGPNSLVRVFTAIGIAIIEGAGFAVLLLFLLVSTFGS